MRKDSSLKTNQKVIQRFRHFPPKPRTASRSHALLFSGLGSPQDASFFVLSADEPFLFTVFASVTCCCHHPSLFMLLISFVQFVVLAAVAALGGCCRTWWWDICISGNKKVPLLL